MSAQQHHPDTHRRQSTSPGDEMLTLQEACAYLRVPEGTLRYWRHLGAGPRSFKIDAERFLATVESAKLTGTYVDPQLAKVTVGAWADQWLANQAHLKPSTH